MISNDYQYEMMSKFNLTKSLINSSVHYKIPKFVFKSGNDVNNQCEFHYPIDSVFNLQVQAHPQLLIDKSSKLNKLIKSRYSEDKNNKVYKSLNRIQRQKIDLLIDKTYQQINDNIRKHNESITIPKNTKIKLKPIPLITREFAVNHVMDKVQRYFPYKPINKSKTVGNLDNNDDKNNSKDKQFIWSYNFMEEVKNDNYRKRYRIKHIDTEGNKYKKIKFIRDKDIPRVIRINTETSFPALKFENYSNNYFNNLKTIYKKTEQVKKFK